jgi:hypothetical protein
LLRKKKKKRKRKRKKKRANTRKERARATLRRILSTVDKNGEAQLRGGGNAEKKKKKKNGLEGLPTQPFFTFKLEKLWGCNPLACCFPF